MHLYHNSQRLLCRSPLGAAPCGARVRLRLRAAEPLQSALLRFYDGSEKWIPMEKEPDGWYAAERIEDAEAIARALREAGAIRA